MEDMEVMFALPKPSAIPTKKTAPQPARAVSAGGPLPSTPLSLAPSSPSFPRPSTPRRAGVGVRFRLPEEEGTPLQPALSLPFVGRPRAPATTPLGVVQVPPALPLPFPSTESILERIQVVPTVGEFAEQGIGRTEEVVLPSTTTTTTTTTVESRLPPVVQVLSTEEKNQSILSRELYERINRYERTLLHRLMKQSDAEMSHSKSDQLRKSRALLQKKKTKLAGKRQRAGQVVPATVPEEGEEAMSEDLAWFVRYLNRKYVAVAKKAKSAVSLSLGKLFEYLPLLSHPDIDTLTDPKRVVLLQNEFDQTRDLLFTRYTTNFRTRMGITEGYATDVRDNADPRQMHPDPVGVEASNLADNDIRRFKIRGGDVVYIPQITAEQTSEATTTLESGRQKRLYGAAAKRTVEEEVALVFGQTGSLSLLVDWFNLFPSSEEGSEFSVTAENRPSAESQEEVGTAVESALSGRQAAKKRSRKKKEKESSEKEIATRQGTIVKGEQRQVRDDEVTGKDKKWKSITKFVKTVVANPRDPEALVYLTGWPEYSNNTIRQLRATLEQRLFQRFSNQLIYTSSLYEEQLLAQHVESLEKQATSGTMPVKREVVQYRPPTPDQPGLGEQTVLPVGLTGGPEEQLTEAEAEQAVLQFFQQQTGQLSLDLTQFPNCPSLKFEGEGAVAVFSVDDSALQLDDILHLGLVMHPLFQDRVRDVTRDPLQQTSFYSNEAWFYYRQESLTLWNKQEALATGERALAELETGLSLAGGYMDTSSGSEEGGEEEEQEQE